MRLFCLLFPNPTYLTHSSPWHLWSTWCCLAFASYPTPCSEGLVVQKKTVASFHYFCRWRQRGGKVIVLPLFCMKSSGSFKTAEMEKVGKILPSPYPSLTALNFLNVRTYRMHFLGDVQSDCICFCRFGVFYSSEAATSKYQTDTALLGEVEKNKN